MDKRQKPQCRFVAVSTVREAIADLRERGETFIDQSTPEVRDRVVVRLRNQDIEVGELFGDAGWLLWIDNFAAHALTAAPEVNIVDDLLRAARTICGYAAQGIYSYDRYNREVRLTSDLFVGIFKGCPDVEVTWNADRGCFTAFVRRDGFTFVAYTGRQKAIELGWTEPASQPAEPATADV